jgi:DNA-binding transcriptional regulator YhcF (GntR family)
MFFKPNPSAPAPIYLQLMEQVRHAVEVGALQPGDQLPGIRHLAETLVINPNTVAKAYRELEHERIIDVRHGSGAFVRGTSAGVHVQMTELLIETHALTKIYSGVEAVRSLDLEVPGRSRERGTWAMSFPTAS